MPVNVIGIAVLIEPIFGEIDVSVGGGGFEMATETAFESAGVAVGLLTVMLAVPVAASRATGRLAPRLTTGGPLPELVS